MKKKMPAKKAAMKREPRSESKRDTRKGGETPFEEMTDKLSQRPGVKNPKALAAFIGRKEYGAKGMAAKAAAGRRQSPRDQALAMVRAKGRSGS